jgi:hypothetical protein
MKDTMKEINELVAAARVEGYMKAMAEAAEQAALMSRERDLKIFRRYDIKTLSVLVNRLRKKAEQKVQE